MSIERYAVIETALCIGGNLHDGEVMMVRADAHDRDLVALREELAVANHEIESRISAEIGAIEALQAAEQRNAALVELLVEIRDSNDYRVSEERINAALKPTESGASE